jgi:hypothetical protein
VTVARPSKSKNKPPNHQDTKVIFPPAVEDSPWRTVTKRTKTKAKESPRLPAGRQGGTEGTEKNCGSRLRRDKNKSKTNHQYTKTPKLYSACGGHEEWKKYLGIGN